MIYLDSAATSYHKPDGVARAVAEAISHMGNPGRGAHEASLDASRVVYGTREKMAELFGAEEASQIVFTANSTESLNIAIQGLVDPGDHVITTVMEHNSVAPSFISVPAAGSVFNDTSLFSGRNGNAGSHRAAVTVRTHA